ncbi:DUF4294 domain-containing protein [Solitalea koreensis]|uniref:DUF4294 domain-containing protein n=1 Tax=Solitalea koreensis TaxID=543615 RepID=A0A521DX18_9SPHI|nr:DUF4294 domain-containing protein [Solitalea koreensis]SMO76247.1 protein of unknown function [Solitalea koreensis]
MRNLILILFLSITAPAIIKAQDNAVIDNAPRGKNDTITLRATIINGDTTVWLPQVYVFDKFIFKNNHQREKYDRLKRDVLKVLPYAKFAGLRYRKLETDLLIVKTEEQRKVLVKQAEDEIKKNFEKDIRNMTIRQGGILIKLLDRETGRTGYVLLKELRNGFTAFCWQSVARIFGNNLKDHYDPEEDKAIESIIQSVGDPNYSQAYYEYYKYLQSQGRAN